MSVFCVMVAFWSYVLFDLDVMLGFIVLACVSLLALRMFGWVL